MSTRSDNLALVLDTLKSHTAPEVLAALLEAVSKVRFPDDSFNGVINDLRALEAATPPVPNTPPAGRPPISDAEAIRLVNDVDGNPLTAETYRRAAERACAMAGLPTPEELPLLKPVSYAEMGAVRQMVYALYFKATETSPAIIYYIAGFRHIGAIHEIVHHAQEVAGGADPASEKMEEQAHEIQATYFEKYPEDWALLSDSPKIGGTG